MRPSSLTLAATIVLAAAGPAAADDPKFVYGKPEEAAKKPVEWTATAEAGIVLTTGNSETTTAGAGVHASRKAGKNKIALDATAAYSASGIRTLNDKNGNGLIDGPQELMVVETLTTELLLGKLRYDRYLDEHDSLYAAALFGRDIPAGKQYTLGGQLGYSRRLTKTKTSEAVAEVGYDYSSEKLIGDPDPPAVSIHSIRAFIGYKATMTEGTDLEASLEGLSNLNREHLPTNHDCGAFDDTRINGRVAISAKIGKGLAVQTSIESHYDNRPGPLNLKMTAPGVVLEASTLDTIMKVNLIYAFF